MYPFISYSCTFIYFPIISDEVTVNVTGYVYTYTHYNVKETSSFTFKVKGPSDAHLGLFADMKSSFVGESFYEIIIGGWTNTKCALRKAGYTGTVERSVDNNNHCHISAGSFLSYWISWEDNIIQLGHGATVGINKIFTYNDTAAPMEINYLALGAVHVVTNQFKYYNG